jgi:hypothetical protein
MNNGQEATYLEHPPLLQENQMEWEMAVIKVSRVIEDDTWFEDDPKALKEKDYGRVYHEPTIQPFTGGYSMLTDIMDKGGNNHLRYTAKHGSARDGVRYRYKKKKINEKN